MITIAECFQEVRSFTNALPVEVKKGRYVLLVEVKVQNLAPNAKTVLIPGIYVALTVRMDGEVMGADADGVVTDGWLVRSAEEANTQAL